MRGRDLTRGLSLPSYATRIVTLHSKILSEQLPLLYGRPGLMNLPYTLSGYLFRHCPNIA